MVITIKPPPKSSTTHEMIATSFTTHCLENGANHIPWDLGMYVGWTSWAAPFTCSVTAAPPHLQAFPQKGTGGRGEHVRITYILRRNIYVMGKISRGHYGRRRDSLQSFRFDTGRSRREYSWAPWCWTMSWGKWWEIRHLRFSKDCDLFVFVFFGFFWLLSLGLSAWVRWVLLPRICKHLESLLLDKLWVVLNDGHHKYAGLIEFDLIMVVWFMMMMMMIYEIEGVTELGASSAWDLSEICFNSLLHRILFGNWISIGYYVWWQRDEGVNMENLPWASGKDLCTV